jgi:hypothetical protein
MIPLEIICGLKRLDNVEIVWRNLNKVHTHRRRHTVEFAGQQARYVLEEFVEDGHLGYWATISNLEVVAGGRAA